MALWQYTFYVFPSESVTGLSDEQLAECFDAGVSTQFWEYGNLNRGVFAVIDEMLPRQDSWSKNIDQYGNLETHCFEVIFAEQKIEDVSFRIDFRTNYESILQFLVRFCQANNLAIMGEQYRKLPMNYDAIRMIVDNSIQHHNYKVLFGS